jgi:hypothetical protein
MSDADRSTLLAEIKQCALELEEAGKLPVAPSSNLSTT